MQILRDECNFIDECKFIESHLSLDFQAWAIFIARENWPNVKIGTQVRLNKFMDKWKS